MALKDLTEESAAMRRQLMARSVGSLDEAAALAESPIEAAMFWALLLELDGFDTSPAFQPTMLPGWKPPRGGPHATGHILGGSYLVIIVPQVNVKAAKGAYRLDLALAVAPDERPTDWTFVDVELDEHDFHERTKRQAAHDRERDQELQAIGWSIARFTGAQVFKSPRKCAAQALKLAVKWRSTEDAGDSRASLGAVRGGGREA